MKKVTLQKALVSGAATISVLGLTAPAVFADGGNGYNSGGYSSSWRNSYNSNNNRCNNRYNNDGRNNGYGRGGNNQYSMNYSGYNSNSYRW